MFVGYWYCCGEVISSFVTYHLTLVELLIMNQKFHLDKLKVKKIENVYIVLTVNHIESLTYKIPLVFAEGFFRMSSFNSGLTHSIYWYTAPDGLNVNRTCILFSIICIYLRWLCYTTLRDFLSMNVRQCVLDLKSFFLVWLENSVVSMNYKQFLSINTHYDTHTRDRNGIFSMLLCIL